MGTRAIRSVLSVPISFLSQLSAISGAGGSIDTSVYYVPVIITLAIIRIRQSRSASWTPTSTHLR